MYADILSPILVATDTTPWSDGAVRLGGRLAGAGADVRLVTVIESTDDGPLACDDARERLDAQVLRTLGSTSVSYAIEHGAAASAIVGAARRTAAELIVLGRTDHSIADRTASQVVRRASVPVLSVAGTLDGRPRRIVIAMDFSRSSIRAARAAITLAAPDASIYLVHVQPNASPVSDEQEGWAVIYAQGIAGAFGRLVRELQPAEGARLETVVLEGTPVPELLAFARKVRADLLVAGAHQSSLDRRLTVGSAAAALLQDAPCSVLMTPPLPTAAVTPAA